MRIDKLIKILQAIKKKNYNLRIVIDRESVENYIVENTHPSLCEVSTELIEEIDGDGYQSGKEELVCVLKGD